MSVPPDVCDAQYPALRPSYGPEIDVTVAAEPRAPPLSSVYLLLCAARENVVSSFVTKHNIGGVPTDPSS